MVNKDWQICACISIVAIGMWGIMHTKKPQPPPSSQTTETKAEPNETEWERGYREGLETGKRHGFDIGVICSYAVYRSVEVTNMLELTYRARAWNTNAQMLAKQLGQ